VRGNLAFRIQTLGASLALALTATACSGGSTGDAGPLPDQIRGLPLMEERSGDDAAETIAQMHGQGVAPDESWVGFYQSGDVVARLYVSRFGSPTESGEQLTAMSNRIGSGSSGFGHHGTFLVADNQIHIVFGHGLVHYFYTEEQDLVWLSVNGDLARSALAEVLETEVDSIPTFQEIVQGREAAPEAS